MTSVNFQQWIQHPETLNRDTLYELRNLLARYPYFQSLRLLYLKNLYILHDISFGGELRKAVLYIADRRQLFRLLFGGRRRGWRGFAPFPRQHAAAAFQPLFFFTVQGLRLLPVLLCYSFRAIPHNSRLTAQAPDRKSTRLNSSHSSQSRMPSSA